MRTPPSLADWCLQQKLTEALKDGKWEEAKLDAAILANYVAEAHDPSTQRIISMDA